mgnify:CR=1 FL=1
MKTAHLDKITRSFEIQAPLYNSEKLHLSKQEYLDLIVEKTAPKSADVVLDVAAGTCVCGRDLAPLVSHVVCLDAWMELTRTPKENREEIRLLMTTDLDRKGATGFFPYLKDDSLYFDQRWVFNLGTK